MKTNTERLKARMEGAKAALEGRKMDANTYDETDELHFEWLGAWTDVNMERIGGLAGAVRKEGSAKTAEERADLEAGFERRISRQNH